MPKYTNRRYRYVYSMDDINLILEIAKLKTYIINEDYKSHSIELRQATYVKDNQRNIYITTKFVQDIEQKDGSIDYVLTDNYPCTWIFDKTGDTTYKKHPSTIARLSQNVYEPKDIVKEGMFYQVDGKFLNSAKPILGFNPIYDNTEHQVYCYDLNSAYAMVLRDKIIDTYNARYFSKVGKNEVGFMLDNDLTMRTIEGSPADVVFPLIDSPYKAYCDNWYNVKKNSPKGSKEKAEAKQVLVITVGLFQLHNPFLRAYVVNSCNDYIQSIIDQYGDKICCWNTDAVYSTEPLDLPIGDEIGKFKLEYQGKFRQKGNNYQKVDVNETTYRGVCKILFKKGWNILTDPLPDNYLPYTYDEVENKVRRDKRYVEEI